MSDPTEPRDDTDRYYHCPLCEQDLDAMDKATWLEARLAALEAAGDALRPFAKHDSACLSFVVHGSARCTCGWSEAAAAWRAAREGQPT
jgi:hypothetical protein